MENTDIMYSQVPTPSIVAMNQENTIDNSESTPGAMASTESAQMGIP